MARFFRAWRRLASYLPAGVKGAVSAVYVSIWLGLLGRTRFHRKVSSHTLCTVLRDGSVSVSMFLAGTATEWFITVAMGCPVYV